MDSTNPPLPANDYITLTISWLCFVFGVLCCAVILHKAIINGSKLRWVCFVVGILTTSLTVCNALRIPSVIPESLYSILRDLNLTLYFDLLVFVTFDLGGKFYSLKKRINWLYYISVVTTVTINVIVLMSIIFQALPDYFEPGYSIDNVMRIIWPVAVIFAYLYAFYPVIMTRSAIRNSPSAIAAVGIWYLVGMGTILLLHSISIAIAIAFPPPQYKRLSIIDTAISMYLRLSVLALYSFPPPECIIRIIRQFFPADSLINVGENVLWHNSDVNRFEVKVKQQDTEQQKGNGDKLTISSMTPSY